MHSSSIDAGLAAGAAAQATTVGAAPGMEWLGVLQPCGLADAPVFSCLCHQSDYRARNCYNCNCFGPLLCASSLATTCACMADSAAAADGILASAADVWFHNICQ